MQINATATDAADPIRVWATPPNLPALVTLGEAEGLTAAETRVWIKALGGEPPDARTPRHECRARLLKLLGIPGVRVRPGAA